mgnify:FL=1
MNQEVVKQLNHLQAQKAELKTMLTEAKLNEEYKDDIEDLQKEIASIESEITNLAPQLKEE